MQAGRLRDRVKGQTAYLADRYSERKESHQELSSRVNQDKI